MCAPPEKSFTGCPKKEYQKNDHTGHSPVAGTPRVWKLFLVVSFTMTKQVRHSQFILMGKFGPTALNVGQHFFLLVILLGHPVHMEQRTCIFLGKIQWQKRKNVF